MSEPLGRDRLGRLVYAGDITDSPDGHIALIAKDREAINMFPPIFVIDLARPPARSNYERYFADIGSLDEVILAFKRSCVGSYCWECPFDHWGRAFGSDDGRTCIYFKHWLKQEATL